MRIDSALLITSPFGDIISKSTIDDNNTKSANDDTLGLSTIEGNTNLT